MARTHRKVRYLQKGKAYTPVTAARDVGPGVQGPRGPVEAVDPFSSVRWEDPAVLRAGAGDSRDFPEDADPTASPDGKRRHGAADRPPSGAAQGRIRADRLGPGSVSSTRRATKVGGAARGSGRWCRHCEQRMT